jgi:seryl-tRNA synthetase
LGRGFLNDNTNQNIFIYILKFTLLTMLDIKLIRENPEIVKKNLERRRDTEKLKWLDDLIKKEEEYRKLLQKSQELRHKRNIITSEITKLKKQGKDIKVKVKEAKELPDKIKKIEERVNSLKEKIRFYLMSLPNIMHKDVPYGKDSSENIEIKRWGGIKKFDFELKSHGQLAEELRVADFERSAKIAGTGFYFIKGTLGLLNQALIRFAIDFLVKKGYTYIEPPLMMNRKSYERVTDLEDFEKVMYKIDGEDLYLIATSEHPIAAMFANETIPEESLPLKFAGYSMCFRKEVGSHGVDTRGLFRTHQFNKVEQFIFCKPKDSWKYHEELLQNSEKLLQKLKIPYRVVNICTGDLGIVAAKKYDIEAWFPRQQKYQETMSNSNCTDYQARRLNIKYGKVGGEKKLVHTLNNTAIATSRLLVAILENYQQEDGSVKIPLVLQPYMNGITKIKT